MQQRLDPGQANAGRAKRPHRVVRVREAWPSGTRSAARPRSDTAADKAGSASLSLVDVEDVVELMGLRSQEDLAA